MTEDCVVDIPRVLIVGARDSSFRGVELAAVRIDLVQSADRITPFQRSLADRVEIVDLSDRCAVLNAARELHAMAAFVGVAAFHEHLLDLAAEVADALHIRGTARQAVSSVSDKGMTRTLARSSSLKQPDYAVVSNGDQLMLASVSIGFPVIVKPLDGAGSADIHFVRDTGGVILVAQSLDEKTTGRWIVEQYLDGAEYSIESFTGRDGTRIRQIIEKIVNPETFVELGHQLPARLPEDLREEIVSAVSSLQTAIGLNIGPAHTEIRVVDGEPYLIETHVRYGGDRIWEMTGLTTGYFPQAEMIAELANQRVSEAPKLAQSAAIRFFTAPAGTVAAIDGVDDARALPGVFDLNLEVDVGSDVRELHSSGDRLGYVLTLAETASQAALLADSALAAVQIRTVVR